MSNAKSNMLHTARGILLFAHGSSDPDWTAPVRAVKAELAQKFPYRCVAIAYLERATPDFFQAATQMVEQGVNAIDVLPIFLGVGKHLKEDFPVMVANFMAAHPGVQIRQLPALGQSPAFAPWVATLIDEEAEQNLPAP